MKILSKKEQLRNKLTEIDVELVDAWNNVLRMKKRKERKDNWGIFSFIVEEHWFVYRNHDKALAKYKLLAEYREVISNDLLSCA
jgi:hypothetical protein